MASGYIKLHRKILDNPTVFKDSDHLAVWIYLLLNATHNGCDVMFRGEKIHLKPGQLTTGRKVIAANTKVNESKVERILKSFENEHQIEQQTSNKCRLISILQWNEYQQGGQRNRQQVNNKWTTTEQQNHPKVNTKQEGIKQECKNDKNVKNDSYFFKSLKKREELKKKSEQVLKEINNG